MNRKPRLVVGGKTMRYQPIAFVTLALFLLAFSPGAKAQSWEDIGGALQGACRVAQGNGQIQIPNLGTLPIGEIPNLEWLCTLRRIYGFVDESLVGGDWGEFGREVAGQWIADFANALGAELGIAGVDDWLGAANDTLRMTYRDFRRQMLYALRDGYRHKNTAHSALGLPTTTAEGLGRQYRDINPMLGLSQEAAANGQIYNQVAQLNRSFLVQKNSEETRENVSGAVGSAINLAQKIVGSEGLPAGRMGQADELTQRAQAALSTRQVAEIQTEALGAILKSDAVIGSTLISSVAELAKQQMLTNAQLSELIARTAQDLSAQAEAQQAALEALAQENLEAVDELSQSGRNISNTVGLFYDSERIRDFRWGE